MAETKRCPNCGGLNPLSAEWCGQCLERFAPKVGSAPAPPAPTPSELAAAPAPPGGATPTPPLRTPAVGVSHGAFTVREHGVVWTCSRCETENALDSQTCSVCGTTFAEVVRPKVERPQRDPGMAAMVSLFLPGAGHAYLGLWGQAVARAVITLWIFFVVLISLLQRGQAGSARVAVVFGIAATALWVVAAHDAYREAREEQGLVLLKGKVFLYTVLGLLVLLVVLLMSSGLSARG